MRVKKQPTGTHFIWRWKLLLIILPGVHPTLDSKWVCQLPMATIMLCNTQLSEPVAYNNKQVLLTCPGGHWGGSASLGQSHSLLSADWGRLWPGSRGNSGLFHMPPATWIAQTCSHGCNKNTRRTSGQGSSRLRLRTGMSSFLWHSFSLRKSQDQFTFKEMRKQVLPLVRRTEKPRQSVWL